MVPPFPSWYLPTLRHLLNCHVIYTEKFVTDEFYSYHDFFERLNPLKIYISILKYKLKYKFLMKTIDLKSFRS